MTKAVLLLLVSLASCANGMDRWVLRVGGGERSALLFAPPRVVAGRALPVVLVFHGGGGDGAGAARLTRFADLAERDTFLAIFPDGLHRNWNDGRDPSVSRTHRDGIDDVAFIDALLDTVGRAFRIDQSRVFATGISNGGIFSHYLGARRSRRIAAIAPVVGGDRRSVRSDIPSGRAGRGAHHPGDERSARSVRGGRDRAGEAGEHHRNPRGDREMGHAE